MVIDQSGRIEETRHHTIIALADKNKCFTIKITSNLKKKLQQEFRIKGKPKVFPIIVFANAVYLVLKKSKFRPDIVIVDIEYPGHEPAIKNIILTKLRKDRAKKPEIYFSNIGKKDPAHIIAIQTFRGKVKSNETVSWKEILELI